MYTTIDETGRLNNYAVAPQMYAASYPSIEQQKTYLIQGSLAAAFVMVLMVVATVAS